MYHQTLVPPDHATGGAGLSQTFQSAGLAGTGAGNDVSPGGVSGVPLTMASNFIASCGAGATGTLHRNSLSRGASLLSGGPGGPGAMAYGVPSRALPNNNERNSPPLGVIGLGCSDMDAMRMDTLSRQQQRQQQQQQHAGPSLHQQMLLTGTRSGDEDSPSIPTPPSANGAGLPPPLGGLPPSNDLRFMGVSPLSPGRSPLSSYSSTADSIIPLSALNNSSSSAGGVDSGVGIGGGASSYSPAPMESRYMDRLQERLQEEMDSVNRNFDRLSAETNLSSMSNVQQLVSTNARIHQLMSPTNPLTMSGGGVATLSGLNGGGNKEQLQQQQQQQAPPHLPTSSFAGSPANNGVIPVSLTTTMMSGLHHHLGDGGGVVVPENLAASRDSLVAHSVTFVPASSAAPPPQQQQPPSHHQIPNGTWASSVSVAADNFPPNHNQQQAITRHASSRSIRTSATTNSTGSSIHHNHPHNGSGGGGGGGVPGMTHLSSNNSAAALHGTAASVAASTPGAPGTPTSALMAPGGGGGTPILSTSGSLNRRLAPPSLAAGNGGAGGAQQLVVKGQGNSTKHHVIRGAAGSELSDDQVFFGEYFLYYDMSFLVFTLISSCAVLAGIRNHVRFGLSCVILFCLVLHSLLCVFRLAFLVSSFRFKLCLLLSHLFFFLSFLALSCHFIDFCFDFYLCLFRS